MSMNLRYTSLFYRRFFSNKSINLLELGYIAVMLTNQRSAQLSVFGFNGIIPFPFSGCHMVKIVFRSRLCKHLACSWMAGSSPAMTARLEKAVQFKRETL
jgi:hypothetical protein